MESPVMPCGANRMMKRWWWIDSICINQANFEERRHQVQLMHLIYRQAEQVIVWLGEPSSDSYLAMDFIRFLDKTTRRKLSVAEVRAMLQQYHYRTRWTALANLLSRKWWSRVWTVQEFVLPPSVSFWCGAQRQQGRHLSQHIHRRQMPFSWHQRYSRLRPREQLTKSTWFVQGYKNPGS